MTIKYAYGYFEVIKYNDITDDTTADTTDDTTADTTDDTTAYTTNDLPELISLDDKIYNNYDYTYDYTYDFTYTYSYFE